MKTYRIILLLLVSCFSLMSLTPWPSLLLGDETYRTRPLVYLLDVDGTINPAVADFIVRGIDKAEKDHAAALIIRMDTPGGVLTSTKTIIKQMTNASVPVVVYVAPSGSSAASAGALITMGADVAAMAPGTNIGAAHPVEAGGQEIGKTMSEKIVNDLSAYMRAIVARKGRNAKWAERAIRESVSITDKEALDLKVIDLTADSVPDLLNKLDGRIVKKDDSVIRLDTKDATVVTIRHGLRFTILDAIANPNVAYILMMVGMIGIVAEIYHPGAFLPGILGGISLLLAFFALQVLPVNYVGVLLIILSIILFILDLKAPSFGILSIGAIISLSLGSIMLFKGGERVSLTVIVPTVSLVSAFFIFALSLVVKARLKKPRTGEQELVGAIGLAISDIGVDGKVSVHGEYWNARSDENIPKGATVRVIGIRDLCLVVTPDASEPR